MALGAINMDIRGVADVQFGEPSSHPGAIQCAAGGVARNIAHNLALLGRDVHLISAVGSDFYGETLLEQTRLAGGECAELYPSAWPEHLDLSVDSQPAKRGRAGH